MIGDELDHSSDQKAKVVTLAIRRGTEEIVLPDPIYFFQDTSFSSHWGISYKDAVRRVNEILGDERVRRTVRFGTLDFDVEVPKRPAKQQKEEWDFATRAHRAIDSANPAALLRSLNLNENDHDLKDKLDRFTSGAVSLGYWLAKAEFAQHAPDARVGKNRRRVSKDEGQKRGAEKQRKADEAWRTFGLTTAIELRVTHPSWGQKRVAKEISKRLVEAGKKNLPDLDTVTSQISKWEHAGRLTRSTKNKNG